MTGGDTKNLPCLAAAYVRMSTEHQQYSTCNQMEVILQYAKARGIEIVKVYSDEGKSGLNLQGRNALSQMLQDVQSGQASFSTILVYDVSRWGRFQDADESAHYEYLCRKAGVEVRYCAEQFENDGSPASTIIKGVKRMMAGEYSRELSAKVFQGACRMARFGYKQGGPAGFGLRRMLIDQSGERKMLLKMRERKSLETDRVILVAGPKEEVEIVQWIYHAFVQKQKTEREIAASLNTRGIKTDYQRDWTRASVHQVLTNEKYIGNNLYHRTSFKLKQNRMKNAPENWIRADGAFEGIVSPAQFSKAQAVIRQRSRKLSNEDMLEKLRGLMNKHGRISQVLIDEAEDMPSTSTYRSRFGTLIAAYRLIGFDPHFDFSYIEIKRKFRKQHWDIVCLVINQLQTIGATGAWDENAELLCVNGELFVSIIVCRGLLTRTGASRWLIRLEASLKPDITIVARMNRTNEAVLDYYILPGIDLTREKLRIAETNGVYLDLYRHENLNYFFSLAERIKLKEAA